MTAYFDEMQVRVRDVPEAESWSKLGEIEDELVHDVRVATMLPGFPEHLVESVDRAVLRLGTSSLPLNMPEPDFEHEWERRARLTQLCSELHDVFHDVVRSGGISDSPLNFRRALAAAAEERQEALHAKETQ